MESDRAFAYCCQYFIEDVTGWRFEEEMYNSGLSEREYLSRYFAARIPGEDCYEKLIMKIEEIAAIGAAASIGR